VKLLPMLRLGIIGCGRVTTMFHLKAIKAAGNIRIIALADNSSRRLQEVKNASGVMQGYLDYKDLLKNSELEAVAINTPPNLHETMVLEALSMNKHVLCEKPLAQTINGCRKIEEKQSETGLVVLPTHQYVFSPSLRKMEDKFNAGDIGKLEQIRVSFENNLALYGSKTDFRLKKHNGLVEDVMPHILSVSFLFSGNVMKTEDVKWWCKSYDICDNMKVKLNAEKNIPIECSLSWTRLIPQFKVMLIGSEGKLSTDLMINPYSYTLEKGEIKKTEKERGIDWYLDLAQYKHPAFAELYRHFSRAVEGLEKQKITLEDEIAITRIMDEVTSMLTKEARIN